MKTLKYSISILLIVLLSASLAAASQPGSKAEHEEFQAFAVKWVHKLNRSHIKGIDRKEIELQPDGTYIARYHAISPSTIKCTVKRTSSKKKGLVGLLRYIETIYESAGATPQEARNKPFKAVKHVRITEIFSNTGKGWR